MRQGEKERKTIQSRIPFTVDPGEKILNKIAKKFKKKKKKPSLWRYFYPKRDEIGLEREENILVTNFVHTRPMQENSKKKQQKNSKN